MIESGYKRRRHGTATVWAWSGFCCGTTSRLWGLWHGLQLSHRGGISLDCKRWCAKVETWNPESETWELADMELETGRAEFGTVTVPSDSIICNSAKILTKEWYWIEWRDTALCARYNANWNYWFVGTVCIQSNVLPYNRSVSCSSHIYYIHLSTLIQLCRSWLPSH